MADIYQVCTSDFCVVNRCLLLVFAVFLLTPGIFLMFSISFYLQCKTDEELRAEAKAIMTKYQQEKKVRENITRLTDDVGHLFRPVYLVRICHITKCFARADVKGVAYCVHTVSQTLDVFGRR